MQEKEFNNLMQGQPAKWADELKMKKPTINEVKKNEYPIPVDKRTEIDIFIDRHRKLGMSERNIRRAVKRKFNIKVIKG
jgi:hypothetical protein